MTSLRISCRCWAMCPLEPPNSFPRQHPLHAPCRNRSAPLHYAAFRGHEDIVRLFLDARAELERRMLGGDTAMHQAAWQGHPGVIELLLSRRANINSAKDDGETPLFLAAYRGHVSVCRRLLEHLAADGPGGVDVTNKAGLTALHSAASGAAGCEEVVRLLLDARADPQGGGEAEEAPLHRAAQAGALAVVEALAEAGSDLEAVRRQDERSALQIAVLEGHACERSQCIGSVGRTGGTSIGGSPGGMERGPSRTFALEAASAFFRNWTTLRGALSRYCSVAVLALCQSRSASTPVLHWCSAGASAAPAQQAWSAVLGRFVTALVLRWYSTGAPLGLGWYYSVAVLVLRPHCAATAVVLLWYCTCTTSALAGLTPLLHRYCTGTRRIVVQPQSSTGTLVQQKSSAVRGLVQIRFRLRAAPGRPHPPIVLG